MANDLENSVRAIAEKAAKYVDDISSMTVRTSYTEVGSGLNNEARLAAETVIRFDGDSEVTVPMVAGEDGNLRVDVDLFNLHQRNVALTIDYRAKMLNSLLALVQNSARRR